jgi:hypothetical protein
MDLPVQVSVTNTTGDQIGFLTSCSFDFTTTPPPPEEVIARNSAVLRVL